MTRIFSLLLSVTLGLSARAADIYVAPTGADTAAGTKAAPFRTLARAQAAVRKLQPLGSPVTIWVRGGTYYFTEPLEFTAADSGSAKAPITYAAYPKETVTLSGGVKLKPTWSDYAKNDKIKVADIGKGYDFDMLFLNEDQPLILARYPNYDATAVPLQGCANISDRIAHWKNPTGGFIRAMHKNGWGGESFRIKSKSGSTLDLDWVGDNNRGQAINPDRQVAENIFEELDAPGEWFYDKVAGKLYLYPPTGANLDQSFLVGATLEELIRFVGTAAKKVEYLTIAGFTLTHTHRTLFTSTYEGLSQGDWAVARKGAVFMQESENIAIKDCDFVNLGGNGVFMSGHNENVAVTGCDFVHIGATAVAVVGLPSSTWFYCTWENHRKRPTNLKDVGPATENYPKSITISDCYVFDNGTFEKQSAPVLISIAQGVTVRRNTFHYGPRSGINIEDGTFGGHVIEFNDVYNQVRETSDHGPFNSWGRDRWWARMDGEEARKYALLDVVQPITIRNNRFHNPPGRKSYGIDLDDGSTNYQISNNLLVNCGFKSQLGFNHTITNNIIIDSLATIHQWTSPDMQKTIARNIFVNENPYYVRSKDFRPNTGTFDYNLFWNRGKPVTFRVDSRGDKTLAPDAAKPTWDEYKTQYKLDAHSVTADPQFADAAKGDYTVNPGSPALSLGFKNFPMDQFGKPGYPVPPGFQVTKAQTPVRRHAAPQLLTSQKPDAEKKVDLGPLDIP